MGKVKKLTRDSPIEAFNRLSKCTDILFEKIEILERENHILKSAIQIMKTPEQIRDELLIIPEHHKPPSEPDLGE